MDRYTIKRVAVCMICLVVMASCICIRARSASSETSSSPVLSTSVMTEPQIAARAAVVVEYETGKVLYEKNADLQLPMASTTKIMTTLLTLESDNIDDWFTVDSEAIKVEGSSMGLSEGEVITKRILAYGMMLPSGNDAANAAAVAVSGSIEGFVRLMNEKAENFGLTNTHFVTPSGLDDYTDEHYSTALDMANLTRLALSNETFREICGTKSICLEFGDGESFWLSNSNKLLSSCEGVIGVKTGFTDKAGRCLASACERDGVTLICVTLSDPNDWYDHTNLYDYCFSLAGAVNLTPIAD
ncbi:MAG: D-alanyl-D-alanine carboxypeptidase [Oscillospiraceae bacterium]|nr:D-alanyl-D-alanine carboxypeptidase [Ruminococcus sp.]MCD8345986.1 D-alanyl-D-alanine carboxypeptidase [Oscillospiraceae bacterium]